MSKLKQSSLKQSLIVFAWGASLGVLGNQKVPVTQVDRFGTQVRVSWERVPHGEIAIAVGVPLAVGGAHSAIQLANQGASVPSAIASLFGEAISPITSLTAPKPPKAAKRFVLNRLPKPLRDKFGASPDLFGEFLKAPHNRIAGRTDAGKSFLTLTILCLYLQKSPNAHVVVCDRNFGKPIDRGSGKPSKPNDWNGLPKECLRTTDDEIAAAVDAELEELNRRIAIARDAAFNQKLVPPFEPRLLIIDEFDSLQEELNEGKGANGVFSKKIKALANQGHGYNMKIVLVGQKLSVAESGINLATLTTFSTIFLGTDTLNPGLVSYLDKHNAESLSQEAAAIAKQRKRPGIIQLPTGATKAIAVPDLTEYGEARIEYCGGAIADETERQWRNIYTKEKQAQLTKLAEDLRDGKISPPPRSGGRVKGLVLPLLGLKTSDIGKPIWKQYGKPEWERILKSVEI